MVKINRGFSLIEMVIAIALIAMILAVVGQTLVIITRSVGTIVQTRTLVAVGAAAIERLAREARQAKAVNASSALGLDPSVVIFDTFDDPGAPATVTFRIAADTLLLTAGGTTASLTPDFIVVDSFLVRQLNTSVSQAVKIDLTVSQRRRPPLTLTLHDTIILRASY